MFKVSKMATHPKVSNSNQHFFDLFKDSKITNLVYCYLVIILTIYISIITKNINNFVCFSYKDAIYTA